MMKTMSDKADLPDAKDAAQAADLLVTVAETLNAVSRSRPRSSAAAR
jgi:hypothetical protein